MPNDSSSLRNLALNVLSKKWDTTWDSRGTVGETPPEKVSHGQNQRGTPIPQSDHKDNQTVRLSQPVGRGTRDTSPENPEKMGPRLGQYSPDTRVLPYGRVFSTLCERCPTHVKPARWQQATGDGQRFLAEWGEQAEALGWTARDLFGLHEVPTTPHPTYQRLSRYDCTGLVWLLQGCPVVALTEETAAIKMPTGSVTTYRKHNKPAYGPLGDSLDDFVA
jgi:hypothetical protein